MTVKSDTNLPDVLDRDAAQHFQSRTNSAETSGSVLLRQTLSLDGDWTFQFADSQAHTILVPAPWESQRPDLRNRAGVAIYERTFTVPAEFDGQCVLLKFGAVDYFAEVWVNGITIGMHEGGYTPFSFPIEHALHGYGPDTVHTITVRVTDATVDQDATLPNGDSLKFAEIPHGKQSWYTSVGGIWQSVTLEACSKTRIERLTLTSNVDAGQANLTTELTDVFRYQAAGWQLRVTINDPMGNAVKTLTLPITRESPSTANRNAVPDNNLTERTLTLREAISIPDMLLWSPDTPHLYTAFVTLECDGEVVDALSKRFGLRKIETRQGHVYLNDRPIFLAGALDQAFYPKTIYTPPSLEMLRDQFVKAKEMGLNLMRCHIKTPTESYLDLCDEIGLLVWYELPNGARLSQAFRERALNTLHAMWERDASHPCIVILTLINESWGIDLNSAEQRRWLADTYQWAKEQFPTWLIVDNSACIPNFHIVSDLDDYHVYFNIPDQAEDFAEWVAAFIGREAGTYTGYGDARYQRSEPLLISEFGNWGLPRVDRLLEAEGGEPYWFKTGDGATRPNRVLDRFEAQRLDRAFKDYNDLAAASQEQEWLSLKWEIEEMRRHPQVAGYVITEFTDVNWECNGLLDMARNPKIFHHRLKDLQAQDILIPRLSPRTSFWENETAMLSVEFSCFTGCSVSGGTLHWEIEGLPDLQGSEPVRIGGRHDTEPVYGSYPVAQVWITAPAVPQPTKHVINLTLTDAQGNTVARSSQNIVFAPVARRSVGKGKTVWLHDPLHTAIGLSSILTSIGCRVTNKPEPGALGLVTRWDPTVSNFLQDGGKAVLVASHAKSITIASGLGVRLLERNTNGWWGDWCTSKLWFAPEYFPSLPDTFRFDFEYQPIVPERVITGPLPENVLAGLFVGWVHNPAAIVARLPIGRGDLIVTTFELLPNIGSNPIATLLLNDLFNLPPAVRSE